MIDKYRWFFDLYLRTCKSMYDPEKPYENLENCIKACHSRSWELLGMLQLLKATGEIEDEPYEAETQKVIKEFSSIGICNAYMEDGEVLVFVERSESYAGCGTIG